MFNIEIAELVIQIDNIYDETKLYCKDFITKKTNPDIIVSSNQKMIEEEKKITSEKVEGYMCEITGILRQICRKLLKYDTLFIHASSIAYKDSGIMFLAKSGTGKSTHSKLWKNVFKDDVRYINDDKPLIRKVDSSWYIYPTPWNGKHRLGGKNKALLKVLTLLERGDKNECFEASPKEMVSGIISQVIIPKNEEEAIKTFDLLSDAIKSSKLYKIKCNTNTDAAIVCKNTIFKED